MPRPSAITALTVLLPLLPLVGLTVAPPPDVDLDAWEPSAARDLALTLDHRLRVEDQDPGWAYVAERSLGDLARVPALRATTLLDVECGATLCRVDADHPDADAADAFLFALQGVDGFVDADLHVRQVADDQGAVFTAAWVARPGAGLRAG